LTYFLTVLYFIHRNEVKKSNLSQTPVRPGLGSELPEESDQFRFLRSLSLANLRGPVGLILAKDSVIPVDLHSSRPFISVLPKRHMLGTYFKRFWFLDFFRWVIVE